jgi:pimeloyl-ACP methyl ester carboxylesterase
MDSTVWEPLWARLPGFRHVGVDLPGHGRSAPMPPGTTLPGLAGLLAATAAEHRARFAVALSLGTFVALELVATAAPDQIDRLVLAAPAIGGGPATPGAKRRERQLSMLYKLAGTGRHLTDLWMTSPPDIFRGTERHPELRERLRQVIDRHRWTELATGAMRTIAARIHTDAMLAGIRADTLLLTGAEDMPAYRDNAERLVELLGVCRSVTVPEAGHLCLLERPDVTAVLIRDHLLR